MEQGAFTYICGFLMDKCLKYHSCEKCIRIEYARSSTKLTDNALFIHFKSLYVDSDSLFGSLIVPGFLALFFFNTFFS